MTETEETAAVIAARLSGLGITTVLACAVLAALRYRSVQRYQHALRASWTNEAPTRPEWFLPALVGAIAAVVPIAHLKAVSNARLLLVTGHEQDNIERATGTDALAGGLAGMVSGVLTGTLMYLPIVIVGTLAIAIWWCARDRWLGLQNATRLAARDANSADAWLRCPGVELNAVLASAGMLIVFGIAPSLIGALLHHKAIADAWSAVANADASLKDDVLLGGLQAARTTLEHGGRIAAWGLPASLCVTAYCAVARPIWQRRKLAPNAAFGPACARGPCAWAALFCLLGIAMIAVSRDHRLEAKNPPLPPRPIFAPERDEAPVPALDGPDELVIAPLLRSNGAELTLDGRPMNTAQLGADLDTLRNNFGILHPREPFPGLLALQCTAESPVAQLAASFLVARRVQYTDVELIVGRWHRFDRPVLGTIHRARFSVVRATLVENGDVADTSAVHLARMRSCNELATTLIERRKTQKQAFIQLDTL